MSEENKEETNHKIAEIEAEFQTKLKEQKSEVASGQSKTPKYTKYVAIVIIVLFSVGMLVLFVQNTNSTDVNFGDIQTDNKNDGYFQPSEFIGDEIELVGKINLVPTDTSGAPKYKYALYDTETVVAYLESKNNDLALSVGLDVTIEGKLVNSYEGRNVVEVNTILIK